MIRYSWELADNPDGTSILYGCIIRDKQMLKRIKLAVFFSRPLAEAAAVHLAHMKYLDKFMETYHV